MYLTFYSIEYTAQLKHTPDICTLIQTILGIRVEMSPGKKQIIVTIQKSLVCLKTPCWLPAN